MTFLSKRQINELEILKELRNKFRRNKRQFAKNDDNKSKEICDKYSDYLAALDTAIICIQRFPFIDFREIDEKYKSENTATPNTNTQQH